MIDSGVISKIRYVYELSKVELSAMLHISVSHLCRIEKNERPIAPSIRQSLIRELALTPEKLQRILKLYELMQLERGSRVV